MKDDGEWMEAEAEAEVVGGEMGGWIERLLGR